MVRPWRSRLKSLAFVILVPLLTIAVVVGIVVAIIDVERCHDRGGIVVAPWTRGSHCAEPRRSPVGLDVQPQSSFPRKREPS